MALNFSLLCERTGVDVCAKGARTSSSCSFTEGREQQPEMAVEIDFAHFFFTLRNLSPTFEEKRFKLCFKCVWPVVVAREGEMRAEAST